MSHPEDLVRVAYHPGFNDGLDGLLFRDGTSQPVARYRAERMVIRLGPPARIVEPAPAVEIDLGRDAPGVAEALADELADAAEEHREVAAALDATAEAVAPKRTRKPRAPKAATGAADPAPAVPAVPEEPSP